MIFSGLLKSSTNDNTSRARRTSTASSSSPKLSSAKPVTTSPSSSRKGSSIEDHPSSHLYIASEDQLQDVEAEAPDLRELNDCLKALVNIFPDVQVDVFREMLVKLGPESRLAVVTEELIKDRRKWAEGRLKAARKTADASHKDEVVRHEEQAPGYVPKEETFRHDTYKLAVKQAAYNEFKGLSHSTVKAVLAEHNHSYTRARPTLAALNAKSWRFSIASIFTRKKANADHLNPWVVWHSTGQGSIYPTLKATGCAELDKELYDELVKPLQLKNKSEQLEKDHTLALEVNTQEAEEAESLHDCECCYGSTTFEELAACTTGDHVVCFQCIKHSISEAVYGQGWARNIDTSTGTLRCIAPVSIECVGCIPQDLIRRALEHEKGGDDIMRKLDERLIEDNLLKAQVPLVRCPFCNYAEIDQIYLPDGQQKWRLRRSHTRLSILKVFATVTIISMIPMLIPFLALMCFTFILSLSNPQIYATVKQHLSGSITRLKRRQHGLRFKCQSPACMRQSCTNCNKAWTDIHICHESSLLALRTEVETAMSLAIKRTCPKCNTSFVKLSGCNKLTCVCGYQMCYVCRKDIGAPGEGYRHFCEHFRPSGGRCTECDKCDLYRIEDDEAVVAKAKEDAEVKWMRDQEGEGDEKLKRELVDRYDESHRGYIIGLWKRRPSSEQVLDWCVEFVIE